MDNREIYVWIAGVLAGILLGIGASWLYVQYGDERWFGYETNEISKRDYSKILQEHLEKVRAEIKRQQEGGEKPKSRNYYGEPPLWVEGREGR